MILELLPSGLRAALLLARGREEGVGLMEAETPARSLLLARHSFLAMALCLPVMLAIHALEAPAADAPSFPLVRDIAGFTLGWLGYAVLSQILAANLGRAALWPRFIVLWNWCNLVQYALLVASLLPGLLGLPDFVAQTAWLAAVGWALWLQWSATRLGLRLTGGQAALLVGTDMALGIVVVLVTGGG